MKKIVKTASPEPKEETQEILNYREDLKEIKVILKDILDILKVMTGGC